MAEGMRGRRSAHEERRRRQMNNGCETRPGRRRGQVMRTRSMIGAFEWEYGFLSIGLDLGETASVRSRRNLFAALLVQLSRLNREFGRVTQVTPWRPVYVLDAALLRLQAGQPHHLLPHLALFRGKRGRSLGRAREN